MIDDGRVRDGHGGWSWPCPWCPRMCASPRSLSSHKPKCPSKPEPKVV